jgi:hypothetical protein
MVTLRILSKGELQEATFAATRRFKAQDIEVAFYTVEAFKDEETMQILYRALSDSDGNPVKSSVDQFRAAVFTDELTELAKAYQDFEAEVSPSLDQMNEADFDKFLADLKKKPDAMLGCVHSTAFAKRLVRSLVDQPPT